LRRIPRRVQQRTQHPDRGTGSHDRARRDQAGYQPGAVRGGESGTLGGRQPFGGGKAGGEPGSESWSQSGGESAGSR